MAIVNILSLDNNGRVSKSDIDQLKITWNNINDKPLSSVTDIDDAVNKKHNIHLITDVLGLSDILATKANTTDTHSHTDLSLLQSFSDIDGILHYNGNPITANFNPGETGSDVVLWSHIFNKPIATVIDIDDAVNKRHIHQSTLEDIDDAVAKKHNTHTINTITGLPTALSDKMDLNTFYTDFNVLTHISEVDNVLHYKGNPINITSTSISWSNIINKPISTVLDIDDTVSKKHQHTNQNLLDIINVDENNNPTWDNKSWPVSVGYVDVKKISNRNIINNSTLGVVFNVEQWMFDNNVEQVKTLYSNLFIVLKNNSIIDDAIVRFTYVDNTFVEVAVNPNDNLNSRITKIPKLISIQGNVEYDINGSFVYNTTNISKQRTLKKVTMNVNVTSLDFFEVFSILQFIEDNINSNDYYIDCMIKIFPTDSIFLKTKNDIQEYTTEFTMNSIVSNTYSQTEFFAKGNGLITFEITWID